MGLNIFDICIDFDQLFEFYEMDSVQYDTPQTAESTAIS